MKYFTQAGLSSGPFSITFSLLGKSENSANRKQVCGANSKHKYSISDANGKQVEYEGTWAGKCVKQSEVLGVLTGKGAGPAGNDSWLSCDEFLFNSMDEGGNPTSNSRSCIPGY
ncbi:chitinase A1 [Penicillium cf. griseofulvum]|nr:chitinase A1 [Penicillium cf. griseofulvum]